MSQISNICKKTSDILERFCLIGAGALLSVNLFTVMLGVFARFYRPPMWTMDLAKITLVWAIMLGAAPALKRGEHMAITILVDKLPNNLHRFIVTVRMIVFFAILLLMLILGIKYAWNMHMFTIMSLNISQTVPLLSIPVGMGLMLIEYTLQQFIPVTIHENNSSSNNESISKEKQP
jgi:TRAP-type C4-dicarboxylate transport system permease small subunit